MGTKRSWEYLREAHQGFRGFRVALCLLSVAALASTRLEVVAASGADQAPVVAAPLSGLNLGPFVNGQDPNTGNLVLSAAQIRARLTLMAPYARWVRAFGATAGLEHIAPIAHELGLSVACGAWLGRDLAVNDTELAALIAASQQGHCDMAIVGSEVLLRRDLSESALIDYIALFRAAAPGVPVTTADLDVVLLEHPAVMGAVDIVLANYYPYWQGIALKYAVAALHRAHQRVVAAAQGKPVMVAETGWPSCGPRVGEAASTRTAAASYLLNFVSWARANAVPYFYFAAFNERWKAAYEGPQGACWGVLDAAGVPKSGTSKVFAGATVADNWSGTALPGGAGTPTIRFTSVPSIGSTANLKGRVRHVAPVAHRVAVYIKVHGGWWTKPTWADPVIEPWPDGTWTCDITTGGDDALATEIVAYLLPAAYVPPLVSGAAALPAELPLNARARTSVVRN